MEPDEKKAVEEAFESHGVWDVPCIWEFQHRFHIETKDLRNLPVCVKIALVKLEHIELVGQYKHIPTDDIDTTDVYDTNHKDITECLHSFHLVPPNYGK